MRTRLLAAPFAALALITVGGCGHSDAAAANAPTYAASHPLGPGDIRITTTDGHVDLVLVDDTISMGLADSLVRSARQDVDTGTAADIKAGGMGGRLASAVKGVVGNALGMRVEVPLQDVEDVRYEDGAIKFSFRDGTGPTMMVLGKRRPVSFDAPQFERNHGDERSALQSFSEKDAERFVAAVRAAKKRG
jgi:hypothetical protein